MGKSAWQKKCIIPKCQGQSKRHYFSLPNNKKRRMTWFEEINKNVPIEIPYSDKYLQICENHFKYKDFTSTQRNRLSKFAAPSFFETVSDVGKEYETMDLCTPTILMERPHDEETICESIEATSMSEQAIFTNSFILTEEVSEDPRPSEITTVSRSDFISIANRSNGIAIVNRSNSIAIANRSDGTSIANRSGSIAIANKSDNIAIATRSDGIALANRSDDIAVANKSDGIGIISKSDVTTISNRSDEITEANSISRKRKHVNVMELEDFCEEDLKDPEKRHRYWLLSQNTIKTITNNNQSLLRKMTQQMEDIKCLKALNKELKIQLSSL